MRSEPLMHIDGNTTQRRDRCYDRLDNLLNEMSEIFSVEEMHEILSERAKDYAPKGAPDGR